MTTLVSLVMLTATSSVLACTCKFFTPDEIATNDKYEFTKLKINYPTVSELWQRLQKNRSFQQTYRVTVLENIKGIFNYGDLVVAVGNSEACGTTVSYGQTLYLIHSASGTDEWGNHASVCNIKNDIFAEEVKSMLKQNNQK